MGSQANVTCGTTIPIGLPRSFQTDLAQLEAGIRPVIRSELHGASGASLQRWARQRGFFAIVDRQQFFALSRSRAAARRVLWLDAQPGPHVISLGWELGYPACCSLAAARRGEERIDQWAAEMESCRFAGLFRLIDPTGYRDGVAFISHVPCSTRCFPSLRMALAVIGRRRRARPSAGLGRNLGGSTTARR